MNQTNNPRKMPGSSWENFKTPSGGSSREIQKGADQLRNMVREQSKAFREKSIVNGGTKVKA